MFNLFDIDGGRTLMDVRMLAQDDPTDRVGVSVS